ncbi:aminotransferase class IV family protein [Streptomyces acidiscabies]|uniref:aminotransferase class IV family protein n=1 Tax=Streptomyces acidiscabies TaxID=42234 RepID=UPI000B1B2C93|nr:aminotransferase class IV family protein [Streptomyces acidiscabies]
MEVDGVEAGVEDLKLLARSSYAHFTSMQVRGGAVRGLDLHLRRLDESARDVFGTGVAAERVRSCLRHALDAGPDDMSVRVTVFAHGLDLVARGEAVEPQLAVTTSAPVEAGSEPMRLRTVPYERDLPHIKHAATFGLTHHRRLAALAGYDDALFTDRHGRISEASVWNVCFYDGERVVWPEAAVLPGITMQLLRRGLEAKGVPSEQREVRPADLTPALSAFLTNSISPALPVASVDGVRLAVDPDARSLLLDCYETNPWEPV